MRRATLHIADVMDLDLAALDPPPDKVIANLPYGVAVPALLRTIAELPQVGLWCVMVQREIADRIAAGPGTRVYGVPSVQVQLACEVAAVRPVSRTIFRPAPHVDSAILVLRRRGPGRIAGGARPGARRVRAPAQGSGRLARARHAASRRCATGPGRRSTRWAIRPTSAPSGSRPRSSPTWPRRLA